MSDTVLKTEMGAVDPGFSPDVARSAQRRIDAAAVVKDEFELFRLRHRAAELELRVHQVSKFDKIRLGLQLSDCLAAIAYLTLPQMRTVIQ